MSKIFAKVNGLHEIFDKVENDLGQTIYNTSNLKKDVLSNHNINENTIFYIKTDDEDHLLDYKGTYIYSHNELFSNYDNKGGQYIQTNIDVEHNSKELGYAFGKITASDTNKLWNISYHIQAYSSNADYNSEYDVCLYGYNDIILSYCTFNAVGAHSPYLNHVIVKQDNVIKVGLSFIADSIDRKISIIINDYRNCIFEQISEPNIVVEGLNVIRFDAAINGFIQKEIVEKVKVNTSTTNAGFPLMAIDTSNPSSGSTYEAIYDTGIVINPSKHSVAEGYNTEASGDYSHAEGYSTIASGTASHAGGYVSSGTIVASSIGSFAYGYVKSDGTISAIGDGAVAMGYADESGTISAKGYGAHAEGYVLFGIIDASGTGSHAEGYNTAALADGAHSEGIFSLTLANGAHTEGMYSQASADGAHAEGITSWALAEGSHAEGSETTATGNYSHTEGYQTTASGYASHAEGANTNAFGDYSHAGGIGSITDKEAMTAIGKYNNTAVGNIDGDYLFVVGNGTGMEDSSRSNAFAVTTNGITASLLNLSGGPYQDQVDPGDYDGGKISWSDDNCWIQETSTDELTIYSSENLYLKSNTGIYANTNISVTGRVNATDGFFQTSDKRQKNIISDLSLEKVYDLIDKCQTIIYTLKDDPENKEQIGMIAQEIQEFFPELISEDKNGMLSLDYSRLTVIIFKVLKDLIERINKIEQKLN